MHVARHHELLSRLNTGEFGEGWRRLSKLLEKAGRSLEADRPDDVRHYLDAAQEATSDALADEKTWKAITTNALTLAKLSDTERKRDEFLARQISADQWARLLGALAKMVARHVTDEETRRAIARDLRPFLSVPRSAEPEVELKLMELTQSRGGNGGSGHRSDSPSGQRAHAESDSRDTSLGSRPRDLSVAELSRGSAPEEVT